MTFPYKHTAYIPRSNDAETFVSTSFQRGINVVSVRLVLVSDLTYHQLQEKTANENTRAANLELLKNREL